MNRERLLAEGWAEPVTDPVRLDTLAHIARNEKLDLIAALPDGTAYTSVPTGQGPIIWWNIAAEYPPPLAALSEDLTAWAAEQDGPIRCWTTTTT